MSAYLDAISGAGYTGDVDLSAVAPSDPGAAGYGGTSGFFQTLTALGTGYLSRRLDVDVQRRVQGAQPLPQRAGTGPYVSLGGLGVPQGTGPAQPGGGFTLPGLLPWALLGIAAFVLLRR